MQRTAIQYEPKKCGLILRGIPGTAMDKLQGNETACTFAGSMPRSRRLRRICVRSRTHKRKWNGEQVTLSENSQCDSAP